MTGVAVSATPSAWYAPLSSRGKIIVGMSGGVDSSVAALRLLQEGYPVEGLFMKNWEEDDSSDYCAAAADLADARAVCDRLAIPLHTVNFASEYWDRVFSHFLAEYRAGRTPNPDILCNREIKFRAFLDYALHLGAEAIATGHYARRGNQAGSYQLLRGHDRNKDQSYFLYTLGQPQLARALFPVGDLPKDEVRRLARQHDLITHDKRDSTGICFIGERKFRDFLQRYLPAQPGAIESDSGEVIGHHHGLMYYTLGQRQGLGIGGVIGHAEAPWYVYAKDLQRNVLCVTQGHDHPLLQRRELAASQLHWVSGNPPALPCRATARVRYRQVDQPCQLTQIVDGRLQLIFEQPQRAITPGQALVIYQGELCLGGGTIE
jgi:tRNA-uridine 2-sulfurtransferase